MIPEAPEIPADFLPIEIEEVAAGNLTLDQYNEIVKHPIVKFEGEYLVRSDNADLANGLIWDSGSNVDAVLYTKADLLVADGSVNGGLFAFVYHTSGNEHGIHIEDI